MQLAKDIAEVEQCTLTQITLDFIKLGSYIYSTYT